MIFEWDDHKNRSNIQKHHLSFDDVIGVFFDPFCLRKLDYRFDEEERWQALGASNGITIVLVAYSHRDNEDNEIIRIISARKADSQERRTYEYGKKGY
ncbi:BrnT family toxin [Psychrobacter arenosus]|uniref:BrnT family toxin n=1 Tax=Psychrobacter arenosus TaxID=256326 RepID=UPI001919F9B7|nr:BrnT family toxin [Psychrobacter arenosus]